MNTSKKKFGVLNTKTLISKIKKLNVLFDNEDHHDSHEFLCWLLNEIHESIIKDYKEAEINMKDSFITQLFEGKFQNSIRCLICENGGKREETFLALSVDIEKDTSLA